MRATTLILAGSFALVGAAWAQEGGGLEMPRWQGRVKLGMSVAADPLDAAAGTLSPRLGSAQVFGDYYFSRSAPQAGEGSGFRATSGVLVGSRLGSWGGPDLWAAGGGGFAVETHRFSLASASAIDPGDGVDGGTVPYFGLGYSSWSAKGGWGFSADLGLMALNPGGVVRFGRSLGAGQNLDDAVRNIRLSPMLQLGVSYAF